MYIEQFFHVKASLDVKNMSCHVMFAFVLLLGPEIHLPVSSISQGPGGHAASPVQPCGAGREEQQCDHPQLRRR